ncbi:Retrovirus-related Pol polyprotein from transposon [Smittium culicis]|uniref:Retrovirus-related Pol polyprotein from transposon n=1 Tax=Smittium culicis TaxID=133412 RepID=A0A1R1YTJ0_9FUNG|nr:Retrovirus-related Pol polyprotein from transposon [Smittium culicis]
MLSLIRKDSKFVWTSECSESFEKIKNSLINAPILVQPNHQNEFILSTDASSYALGAVLEQFDEQKNLRVIAYYSRTLQKAERNYLSYEKEALAVIAALKNFRSYLIGRKFTIYTDNSAVASLYKAKDSYGRITRWIQVLSEFDATSNKGK